MTVSPKSNPWVFFLFTAILATAAAGTSEPATDAAKEMAQSLSNKWQQVSDANEQQAAEDDDMSQSAQSWAPAMSWEAAEGEGAASLQEELAVALGPDSTKDFAARLPALEEKLQPMFASIPKNEYGRLGHSAVRYTLNRLFVQRHGWFVNGLFAGQGGVQFNDSSVTGLLVDFVQPKARNVFEKHLSGQGLDLHGTALLAATIEGVVMGDVVLALRDSYRQLRIPTNSTVSPVRAETLVSMHTMRRVAQIDNSICDERSKTYLTCLERAVKEVDPRWQETVQFLHELRLELQSKKEERWSFSSVADLATELESRWSPWRAARNCQPLKTKLMAIEEGSGTGCVRLSDFYARSMDPVDGWQFKESPAYLRQLGALDDTDPKNPRIIIPNYINTPANCFANGKHYQACCINECEDLQVQIERALQSSEPEPMDIIAFVRTLSTATFSANKMLSTSLRRRLASIADLHGGKVPLQSRLFAQWMHFAFPRECPFPHLSGSTKPVELNVNSDEQFVTDKLAHWLIREGKSMPRSNSSGTCMQWRKEEELFVPTVFPGITSLAALAEDSSVWATVHLVTSISSLTMFAATMFLMFRKNFRAIKSEVDTKPVKPLQPAFVV